MIGYGGNQPIVRESPDITGSCGSWWYNQCWLVKVVLVGEGGGWW